MDPLDNPYTPGAGSPPKALAGRENELEAIRILVGRLSRGNNAKSLLITGLRGVGKTVLLDASEALAIEQGWFASSAELTHDTSLPRLLATLSREALIDLRKSDAIKNRIRSAFSILKSFTISTSAGVDFRLDFEAAEGHADSGDLGRDIGDLLIEIGTVAKECGRGVLFLLDEVQFLAKSDFEALIAGLHRVSRKNLPIAVVGAGLPMLPKLAGEAKSYSERLFSFPRIGTLSEQAAIKAITEPPAQLKVNIDDEAVDAIRELSGDYPYFVQQYGAAAWNAAPDGAERITKDDVLRGSADAQNELDRDFFQGRMERTTPSERRYIHAMAKLGDGMVKSGQVSKAAGYSSTQDTGTVRDGLIKKGLIYMPRHSYVEFTVPHFAAYVRRAVEVDVEDE